MEREALFAGRRWSRCSDGMTRTRAICPGAGRATRTACGFRRSCCSRRAWRLPSPITSGSSSRFPTLQALADAPEERLLKLWEGLGYYSRARNLQKAARQALERFGALPGTASELASLAGIGPYTAGGRGVDCIRRGRACGGRQRPCACSPGSRTTAADTASPAARREAERALAPVIPRDAAGRFQPGAHGAGRGDVPAERRAALRGLPALRALPGPRARHGGVAAGAQHAAGAPHGAVDGADPHGP